MGANLMAYEVHYDDGAQQWSAFFESSDEALNQAAADMNTYGGVAPQEVVDDTGTVVHDQDAIEAAAEAG
jgi:hypothetical protein